jgi:hypothetical protein
MKRFFSIQAAALALLLIAGSRASAQDVERSSRLSLTAGPKIGVNLSKLDGETWDGGYKTNLLGGAWLGVIGSRFGIQVEGLFSQTTYVTGDNFNAIYQQYIQNGRDSVKNGAFRVNYFNIPLLAQIRILNRVWLQIGPQYSGVVSVKDKDDFVKDATALFDKGSFSGVAGLWIDMTRHINVGARYVQGFSNMTPKDVYNEVHEKSKMRDVQIHIGYRF